MEGLVTHLRNAKGTVLVDWLQQVNFNYILIVCGSSQKSGKGGFDLGSDPTLEGKKRIWIRVKPSQKSGSTLYLNHIWVLGHIWFISKARVTDPG